MKTFTITAALLLLTLPKLANSAVCAPSELIKVVTSVDHPDLPKGHFGREPKILYRVGEKKGRVEELPNPETGLHLLIVVNEPDVWMLNRNTNRGNHIVDPGPTYYFRAPLFRGAPIESDFITNLEVGCEINWLHDKGVYAQDAVHPEYGKVNKFEYIEGSEKLVMYSKGDRPLRVEIYGHNEYTSAINYVSYETNLQPKPSLFHKPIGVIFDTQY